MPIRLYQKSCSPRRYAIVSDELALLAKVERLLAEEPYIAPPKEDDLVKELVRLRDGGRVAGGRVVVAATLRVAQVILIEASLSYFGLGVPPPAATWGNMVADGRSVLDTAWWVTTFPGVLIVLTVLAYNLMGDGLRDVFDPRRQRATRVSQPTRSAFRRYSNQASA